MRSSRSVNARRLPSTSKIPPEVLEAILVLTKSARAIRFRHVVSLRRAIGGRAAGHGVSYNTSRPATLAPDGS
jgi:tryptophan 2,3-dioxygenase